MSINFRPFSCRNNYKIIVHSLLQIKSLTKDQNVIFSVWRSFNSDMGSTYRISHTTGQIIPKDHEIKTSWLSREMLKKSRAHFLIQQTFEHKYYKAEDNQSSSGYCYS